MAVLQGVLASAGLMAVLMGLIWRMFVHFDAKNEQAHAAIDDRAERPITANVQAVDDRAERRAEAHRAALEAHRTALESIARDVSFLSGRQAERDRQAGHASG